MTVTSDTDADTAHVFGWLFRSKEERDLIDKLRAQSNYPDYESAINGIISLENRVYKLMLANAILTSKRPKGRPKAVKFDTETQPKKKAGRPPKETTQEKQEKLQEWDDFRSRVAKNLNKKSVSDKVAIDYFCQQNGKGTPQRKLNEISTIVLKRIGYLRDQTGIRMRKNKSRKLKK